MLKLQIEQMEQRERETQRIRKNVKRAFSIFLVIALMFSALPSAALAIEQDANGGEGAQVQTMALQAGVFSSITVNGRTALGADITGDETGWTITLNAPDGAKVIVGSAVVAGDNGTFVKTNSAAGGTATITGSGPLPTDVSGVYLDIAGARLQSAQMWSDTTEVGVINIVTLPAAMRGTIDGPAEFIYNGALASPSQSSTAEFYNGTGARAFSRIDIFAAMSTAYSITEVRYFYEGMEARSVFDTWSGTLPAVKFSGEYNTIKGVKYGSDIVNTSSYGLFRYSGPSANPGEYTRTTFSDAGWYLNTYNTAGLSQWLSTRQVAGTELTEVVFTFYNPSSVNISNVAISMDADVMIGPDYPESDRATIGMEPNGQGFIMSHPTKNLVLALINPNANKYGVGETAPNWWGAYRERVNHRNDDEYTTAALLNTDSGAVAKVRNITVLPGAMQSYSFIIGTGDWTSISEDIETAIGDTLSDECIITSVPAPLEAIIDQLNFIVDATIEQTTDSHRINVTVSSGAAWEVFSDPSCAPQYLIADKTLTNLVANVPQTVYIKVTAQNGVDYNIYTFNLTRLPSTACDIINVLNPTLTAIDETPVLPDLPVVRTTVLDGTHNVTINPSDIIVSEGATWQFVDTNPARSGYDITFSGDGVYEFLVEVTAEDGVTTKTYKFEIARPASSECEIILFIEPDESEVTRNGLVVTQTVAKDVDSQTIDVIVSDYATWDIYTDPGCNDKTPSNTISLSPGENTIYIKVVAEDGVTNNIYTMTITREEDPPAPPPPPPPPPPTPTPTPPIIYVPAPEAEINVFVDGLPSHAGTVTTDDDGIMVTADKDILEEEIKTAQECVTVVVPDDKGMAIARVVVKTVEDLAEKDLFLTMQSGGIKYDLPAAAVDTQAMLDTLGAEDSSLVPFDIMINPDLSEIVNERAERLAIANGAELVLPPIEFIVSATYKGKTVQAGLFSRYVSRTVEVEEDIAEKITTAVVVETDRIYHVPTYVYEKDGKWFAEINSITNSIYALIYNERSFIDATGGGYSAVISETGGRMIVNGVGHGLYETGRYATRAEFAVITVRALGLPVSGDGTVFKDVPKSAWYCGAVETAYRFGLVSGVGGDNFAPDKMITRQEAVTLICRAAVLAEYVEQGGDISRYPDAALVSSWATPAIVFNAGAGIVFDRGGLLAPFEGITREEAANTALRMLQKAGLVDIRSNTGAMGRPEDSIAPGGQPRRKPEPILLADDGGGVTVSGGGTPPDTGMTGGNTAGVVPLAALPVIKAPLDAQLPAAIKLPEQDNRAYDTEINVTLLRAEKAVESLRNSVIALRGEDSSVPYYGFEGDSYDVYADDLYGGYTSYDDYTGEYAQAEIVPLTQMTPAVKNVSSELDELLSMSRAATSFTQETIQSSLSI